MKKLGEKLNLGLNIAFISKSNKKKFNYLLLIFIFYTHPGFSSNPHDLKKLISETFKNSSEISSLYNDYLSKIELQVEAKKKIYPVLNLTSNYTKQKYPGYQSLPTNVFGDFNFMPNDLYSIYLELEQPLYMGGRIEAAYLTKEIESEISRLIWFDSKQKLLNELVVSYWSLSSQKMMYQVVKNGFEKQKKFWELTKKKFKSGNARDYEVLQAESDYLSYEPRLSELNENIESLTKKIQKISGTEFNHSVVHSDIDVNYLNIKFDSNKILELILNNPQLSMMNNQIKIAEYQKKIRMGEEYPTLAFRGRWGRSSPEMDELKSKDSTNSLWTLQFSLPIFSGLSSINKKRSSELLIQSAIEKRDSLKKSLINELQILKMGYEENERRWNLSKKWLQVAEKAYQEGVHSYQRGLTTSFQVVQLQSSRERAALSEINYKMELIKKQLLWAVNLGMPIEKLID